MSSIAHSSGDQPVIRAYEFLLARAEAGCANAAPRRQLATVDPAWGDAGRAWGISNRLVAYADAMRQVDDGVNGDRNRVRARRQLVWRVGLDVREELRRELLREHNTASRR